MNLFSTRFLIIKACGLLEAFLMNSRMCTSIASVASIALGSYCVEEKCNRRGLSLLDQCPSGAHRFWL